MMARGNLSAVLDITLKHEGGYVDHPSDPGGATNLGITFAVLQKWRGTKITKQDVKNLTKAEAEKIYDRNYWFPIKGEMLPYGVDLATFDGAVNSGPNRGAKWLQRAVGVSQDGQIGTQTLQACARVDGDEIVRLMCAHRLSFVQGLGTFKVFGKGWSRRIADIEARGVAMWLRFGAGKSAVEVTERLDRDAKAATETAGKQSGTAAGAGAGGALAGGGDIAAGGTVWLLIGAALLVVMAIGLVVKSRQNRDRAAAYEAAALDAMAGQ